MRYSKEYKLVCVKKYKSGKNIQDPVGCTRSTFLKIFIVIIVI